MPCPDSCSGGSVRSLTDGEQETVAATVKAWPSEHPVSSFERCSWCGLVFKQTYLDGLPLLIKAGILNNDITGDGFTPFKSSF
jgi:hypothetical protein